MLIWAVILLASVAVLYPALSALFHHNLALPSLLADMYTALVTALVLAWGQVFLIQRMLGRQLVGWRSTSTLGAVLGVFLAGTFTILTTSFTDYATSGLLPWAAMLLGIGFAQYQLIARLGPIERRQIVVLGGLIGGLFLLNSAPLVLLLPILFTVGAAQGAWVHHHLQAATATTKQKTKRSEDYQRASERLREQIEDQAQAWLPQNGSDKNTQLR